MKYFYVVQDIDSGKFADGYFGFDGNIHGEEQIFETEDIPYKEEAFYEDKGGLRAVLVGWGDKPKLQNVQEYIYKRLEAGIL